MMRSGWRKARDLFSDGMRQQVTFGGFLFTVLLILVGIAAFVSANNLVFLIFAALLATFLISGLVSRLGLAGLELSILLPDQISAGRKVTGRLRVRNAKLFMPSFSLHLSGSPDTGLTSEIYIPLIPAGATLDEPVDLEFARRGLYKDNTFAFTSRFPFGFTQRRAHVRLDQEILVYPPVDPQPGFEELLLEIAGDLHTAQRGRGNDFYRIRPYEALESARHVDWRATAHTGELQVREYTREQDPAATIYLDLGGPEEAREWFEKAVGCSAYLAWQLTRRGSRLRLVTQDFDARAPEETAIHGILKYLALVAPAPGAGISLPHDRNYQIAFSARPDRLVEAGWQGHRLLGENDLGSAGSRADAAGTAANGTGIPGAGAELDHDHRAHRDRGPGVRDGARR